MNETKQQSARFQFGLKWLFIITAGWAVLFSAVAVWIQVHPSLAVTFCGLVSWAVLTFIRVPRRINIQWLRESMVIMFWTILLAALVRPAKIHDGPRYHCQYKMMLLGRALENYHAANGCFPPAYVTDESGKPMHSWRVLLLPYMHDSALYSAYHFDEPWDGPNNSRLLVYMPREYKCPSDSSGAAGTKLHTSYVLVTGPGAMWPGEGSLRTADATDGAAQTALVIEVRDSGIHWMEPRDIDISELADAINPKKGKGISSNHSGGANVLFVDGSVQFIREDITPEQLKALLTRAGGEKVELDDFSGGDD